MKKTSFYSGWTWQAAMLIVICTLTFSVAKGQDCSGSTVKDNQGTASGTNIEIVYIDPNVGGNGGDITVTMPHAAVTPDDIDITADGVTVNMPATGTSTTFDYSTTSWGIPSIASSTTTITIVYNIGGNSGTPCQLTVNWAAATVSSCSTNPADPEVGDNVEFSYTLSNAVYGSNGFGVVTLPDNSTVELVVPTSTNGNVLQFDGAVYVPSITPNGFGEYVASVTGPGIGNTAMGSCDLATCDIEIISATPTAESYTGSNDGSITVVVNSSNPPVDYAISGPINANNSTGIFNGLIPGMYNITVTDAFSGGTCEATSTATVLAGVDPTVSQTDEDGDGTPDIMDPCACNDLLNILDGSGYVTHFHDFVLVNSGPGETWQITALNSGAIFDAGLAAIPVGTVLPEVSPGVYRLDLYHPVGIGFNVTVDRTAGGGPFPLMTGGTCNACPIQAIPTMGEWGLIILALLLLSFATVFMIHRQTVMEGVGSVSSATAGVPFDSAIYSKMLVYVMVGIAVVFTIVVVGFGYEMTTADVPGSLVAGAILAYLSHLLISK